MQLADAVRARRSVRRAFEDRAVPADVVDRVVESGLHAPSSKNAQPWRLHVVTDPALGRLIATAMRTSPKAAVYVPTDPATGLPRADFESSVGPSADVIAQARLNIVIENLGAFSGGRRNLAGNPANLEEALVGYTFEAIGIGAAIENLWLAATDEGLAGVFIGDAVIAEDEIKRLLSANCDVTGDIVGILALGYSQDPQPAKELRPGRVVQHRPAR